VTLHTRTPLLTSYFDFGPVAEQVGAPDVLALPIQAVEREVPLEKRALTLALQGGLGALLGVDVDQIRLLANNLHLNLNDGQRWSTSIGNGGINLNLSLQSSQPSVVCEGHFKLKVGYVLTLADGWADEFCPDFDLSQMDLSVRLVPTVVDGALTVGDAQVTVQLEPVGAQSELIDFFVGATTIGENRIATTIRTKLLEEKTKVALGKLLTKALQHKFPDMCRVVSAQVSGSDLVIQYQAPLRPGLPCPGSSSGNAPPF
jgi:hypothetical protein